MLSTFENTTKVVYRSPRVVTTRVESYLPPRRLTTVDRCSPPNCCAFSGAAAYIEASSTAAAAPLAEYHKPCGSGQAAAAAAFHCRSCCPGMRHTLNSLSELCRRPFQPIRQLSAGSRGSHCMRTSRRTHGLQGYEDTCSRGEAMQNRSAVCRGMTRCSRCRCLLFSLLRTPCMCGTFTLTADALYSGV
jgi:hypothetical protein